MRHTRIQQAKPERSFAERIVAVIVAIAMLGGMGYATTSAALAEDTPATVETTTDQSATTANESTDGKNAADGTDADNAGDAATGTADTESDTNTGVDAGVNTANAANVGDAASSDANSQTDTTAAQSNPQTVNAEQNTVTAKPDPLGVPEHHKTIAKKTGDNDTYTLNLNVTGKRSSTSQTVSQPVDIALVLDNSGSMAYCMRGRQPSDSHPCSGDDAVRSAALKMAVTAFLDGVDTQNKTIANADNKVQVSLVSFAGSASTLSGLTPDVTTLKTKVNSLKPKGATNTADGFSEAKSTLDKDTRTNAIKYVVFFTDGVPTKSDTFSSTVANQTLTTAKQLKDANVGVYSVGIFSGADTSVTSYDRWTNTETRKANVFMNAVSSNYPNYGSVAWNNWFGVTLSGGSDKGYYKTASTASELSKVFEDIQQTITTTNGYTGVTIQDTLSGYAEFADADPAETAKVVTNDGTDVTTQWNIEVHGKTITASPRSPEPLPDGVTYTLQFDIKPTQKAYDDYAKNKNDNQDGYNNVIGSEGSDAAGNATSKGKPGFYTNDSACLAYLGDGETHACTPYEEKPVDQVKTGAITVQKKWVDADGKESVEGNPGSVTFTLQIDGKDSKRDVTATAGTGWKATFENLAPGHTYKVVEKAVTGYEPSYKSQDVTITADELWKANSDANTADNVKEWNVTVTNTHKKSTLAEGSIKVSKSISGREWNNGDSFDFAIDGTGSTPDAPLPDPASITINAHTAKYEASFGEIVYKTAGTYTYTVKETKPTDAIAGLHYSQAKYTVTVKVPTDMGTPTVSIKQGKDDNGEAVDDNQSVDVAKFTNTYVAVSALPLTGGTTDRQWLFVGGAVGGLAVLLVGAAGIWNSKKRLV